MKNIRLFFLAILLILSVKLLGEEIVFVNGTSFSGDILKVKNNEIYIQKGENLVVVAADLVTQKLPDKYGRINHNSYINLIKINHLNELSNLPQEKSCYSVLKSSLQSRNFIFLEASTVLKGLYAGINYEFFLINSLAVSMGYYTGSSDDFYFIATKETKIKSIPFGVILVPNIQRKIAPEFGYFIEYIEWEVEQTSLLEMEQYVTEKNEEFEDSVKVGIRYQPDKEGFAFKSGAKLFLEKGSENLGIYLNFGVRF